MCIRDRDHRTAHKNRRHPKLDANAVNRLRDLSDARERRHRREAKKPPPVTTDTNPGTSKDWDELLGQFPGTQNDNIVEDPGEEENNNKKQTMESTEVREAQVAEEEGANQGQDQHEDSSL